MFDNRKTFQKYAKAYDVLYQDKDYEAECSFLEEAFRRYRKQPVKNILDLGCGTGGHTIPLAQRGYTVHGVDRSKEMIKTAKQKAINQELEGRVHFKTADIQKLNLRDTFDAVICMFAVLSYQTSNDQLFKTLQTIRKHLKPNGLFLCDFWYGPAVLAQKPRERKKILNDGDKKIIRIAKPSLDYENNIVIVSYQLSHVKHKRVIDETREDHHIRYYFRPEMEFFLSRAGLKLKHFCSFPHLDVPISKDTWNVSVIAQAG